MNADRSLTDLSSVIRLHGRYRPRKPAIIDGEHRIDYATLDASIDALCYRLAEMGVVRGDLVGVCLKDTAFHLVCLFALARIGAVILPMDCRWAEAEKRAMTERFEPHAVLTDSVDDRLDDNWLHIEADWAPDPGRPYRDPEVGPSTPLLLSLSSGTTGAPTGPRLSHRQFENRFMAYWIDLGLSSNERFVSATPLYFGGGRGFALALLYAGATIYMCPPPYKPAELVDYVRKVSATSLFLVPTLLRRLMEDPDMDVSLPSVERLISSGSILHPEERQAIVRRVSPNLFQFYSSTEGGSITMMPPSDLGATGESVGRPCFRVEVEVVSNEHVPLPAGSIGLLRYRSPASPSGFHIGDSEAAFRDGWFYPGDLATLDEAGYLYLRGRSKDMIIRGGVNIYPADVERVLVSMPQIADAAVVGIPAREMGEEVAAFVVATQQVTEAEITEFCRKRLAAFKVPKVISFVADLPKSSGGKVMKRKLLEAYIAENPQ